MAGNESLQYGFTMKSGGISNLFYVISISLLTREPNFAQNKKIDFDHLKITCSAFPRNSRKYSRKLNGTLKQWPLMQVIGSYSSTGDFRTSFKWKKGFVCYYSKRMKLLSEMFETKIILASSEKAKQEKLSHVTSHGSQSADSNPGTTCKTCSKLTRKTFGSGNACFKYSFVSYGWSRILLLI